MKSYCVAAVLGLVGSVFLSTPYNKAAYEREAARESEAAKKKAEQPKKP